jgi:hypothetical protein
MLVYGTQYTCFTSTKVQILMPKASALLADMPLCARPNRWRAVRASRLSTVRRRLQERSRTLRFQSLLTPSIRAISFEESLRSVSEGSASSSDEGVRICTFVLVKQVN